ncbi:MAG TPA: hypothetical protein VGK93_08355 [Candidatus Eisenbacteria bacterium]
MKTFHSHLYCKTPGVLTILMSDQAACASSALAKQPVTKAPTLAFETKLRMAHLLREG